MDNNKKLLGIIALSVFCFIESFSEYNKLNLLSEKNIYEYIVLFSAIEFIDNCLSLSKLKKGKNERYLYTIPLKIMLVMINVIVVLVFLMYVFSSMGHIALEKGSETDQFLSFIIRSSGNISYVINPFRICIPVSTVAAIYPFTSFLHIIANALNFFREKRDSKEPVL